MLYLLKSFWMLPIGGKMIIFCLKTFAEGFLEGDPRRRLRKTAL